MDHRRHQAQLLDRRPQLLDESDRAVTAARTADGDGQIGLALTPIRGQDETQEILDPPQELTALLVPHHELPHLALTTVERAQLLHEMRIGKEAHVEDE